MTSGEQGTSAQQSKREQLFEQIPVDGTLIGNIALREQLGWSAEEYLEVRKPLLEAGRILTGKGRGGSVRRANIEADLDLTSKTSPADDSASKGRPDPYPNETSLYEDLRVTLRSKWIPEKSYESAVVEDTAQGGRRKDGIWTRPDITVAAMISYTYVPGRHFEIVTFEVKHHSGLDVTAVYEALGHLRAATSSHVLAYIPENLQEPLSEIINEIAEEANKHGIGFIVASDPKNFDTWNIVEDSETISPDPSRLNHFISSQFKQETKDRIVRWFR